MRGFGVVFTLEAIVSHITISAVVHFHGEKGMRTHVAEQQSNIWTHSRKHTGDQQPPGVKQPSHSPKAQPQTGRQGHHRKRCQQRAVCGVAAKQTNKELALIQPQVREKWLLGRANLKSIKTPMGPSVSFGSCSPSARVGL